MVGGGSLVIVCDAKVHKLKGNTLTIINDYVFLARITFGIYGVNSSESLLAIAKSFVVFILLYPSAS